VRRTLPAVGLLVLVLGVGGGRGLADPPGDPPLFTNVAGQVGLGGVLAKDCLFTDLDGDGYWDLCLDRQRLYLNHGGKSFTPYEDSHIAFPVVTVVPIDAEDHPDPSKAKTGPYVPQVLQFADVDADGDEDAVFTVHATWRPAAQGAAGQTAPGDPGVRSRVWLNDGKGHFTPGPSTGFASKDAYGPSMALAFVDADLDGRLDLFEGREYRHYGVLDSCGVDRLWKGDGKGAFEDVTEAAGLMTRSEPGKDDSSRPTYGVTTADWNGDGWPDLLALSYGRQWNRLWKNQGDGTFEDVGRATGFAGDDVTDGRYPDWMHRPPELPFRSNGNSFDCAVGDVDGDGDLDLFLGEIQHAWAGAASDPSSLLLNEGREKDFAFRRLPIATFLPRRGSRMGPQHWNHGDLHVAFFDADNDGRLDLLIGSGDYPDGQFLRLYLQHEGGNFEDVTEISGFHWEGCGDISLGDYDRDGDVDILAGRSFMRLSQAHRDRFMGGITKNEVALFRNDIANQSGNHWLNVRLRGRGAGHSNGDGIGARILVRAGGRTQIREIRSGSGLSNHADAPEACFGLGKSERVDHLEVHWPDRAHTVQKMDDVPADQFLVIEEPAGG
jgi:hypothetical protein